MEQTESLIQLAASVLVGALPSFLKGIFFEEKNHF